MGELLNKIWKAVDAVSDIITQEESSMITVDMYTYDDFNLFCKKNIRENQNIMKCTLAVLRTKEFENMVFAEYKYVIRILFLDSLGNPIQVNSSQEAYMGLMIIASGIDRKLKELIGDYEKKTLIIRRR